MLVGAQLQAVASTLVGATRLQRSVMGASKAADGTGDYDLFSALTERIMVQHLYKSAMPSLLKHICTLHAKLGLSVLGAEAQST